MRVVSWFCVVLALGSCSAEDVYFIPGTGTLPDCNEAPVADLNDTCWFDRGVVTIESAGCGDAMPSDELPVCALAWSLTQEGNDVAIIVDGEYRIDGRLCGDRLYLRGGWWVLVENGGICDYQDEESADEVSIQAEGNVLTVIPASDATGGQPQMTGTLAVRGSCSASYDVMLQPGGGCFF
jgi:hypothetical protein